MKLMVVEDEKVIRNGLLKHVPWQKLGVWEVQAAENGEKALELRKRFIRTSFFPTSGCQACPG